MSERSIFDGAVEPDAVERIAVADGVSLHALRWHGGGGAPFVLVHGLASNAHLWDGVSVELARRGHPVLAIDQRGHGRSDKPADGYSTDQIVEDLSAVIDWSGFDRPVVAGQSWGANVVLELAARQPGLTRAVVCVDGGTIDLRRQFGEWDAVRANLAPPRTAGMPAGDIEQFVREGHPDWPETGIAGALACFELRDDGTVAPWLDFDRHLLVLRGLYDHDPTCAYPGISDPVIFLAADSGEGGWTQAKRKQLAEAEAAIADCTVQWMVGDHDLHAQYPDEVADLLVGVAAR